VALTWQ